MKEPKREALPKVTGWLVAPTRDFCLFFIRDPKSSGGLKKHFLDLDNSYWYGRSFVAHHKPGVQTPFGLELKE